MANQLRFFILLLPLLSAAQKIDNTPFFRDMDVDKEFRFTYENDYFGQGDYYYSQGFSFELVDRSFKGNPVNLIFPKLKNSYRKYSLAFEHNVFTPVTITSDSILHGDRPFAATISIRFMLTTTDTIHHLRLSSMLSFGAIGPGAFGEEMQTGLHQFIGSVVPKGWQYQIRNDLLLNYELSYEQQLLRLNDFFAMHSNVRIRVGTINTNMAAGLSGAIGKINFPYSRREKKKFLIYAYGQITGAAIGYDATLQGGLVNRNSPYTLDSNDISRLTLERDFGVVVQWKRYYLEYSHNELTKEFHNGNGHRWGGIRMAYAL